MQVIGYSEQLDLQDRTLVLKCTEDSRVWGYITQAGYRMSDSQFDVAYVPEEYADWTQFAKDWLISNRRCYQVEIK